MGKHTRLISSELPALVFGHGHELLDGEVFCVVWTFDSSGDQGSNVGKLEKRG